MNSRRTLAVAAIGLCAALWTYACGDGATEPSTPAPPAPPQPTTVTVSPATTQLASLGATVQLSAEVRDQNGNAMAGAAVSWASSAAAVAAASNAGLVTAAGNGTATITATAGSASGSATVTVAQEVNTVTVTPAGDTLVAGDTLRLAVEAFDANGHAAAQVEFSWASSDTLVATVDAAGLVTAVRAGEAEVSATAAGITGRAELTVVPPAPTSVAVTPDTVALTALGHTAQLTAEVRDQAGRVMESVPVSWASADTTVAAVDSAGLVTAAGSGTTTITASAGSASGEAFVTVMQSAGSIVVSPPAVTIALSDTLRLVAEAFDENGHAVEGAEFTWSSSNAAAATVNASGLVRGVAEGRATIMATAGSVTGTSEIAVENPDRAALVALYEATDGPNWVNNHGWLTDAPLGEWYGVDTDAEGRVVRLDLAGNTDEWPEVIPHGLSGPIPPELGNLTHLTSLYLQVNQLSGPIPPELGGLANLRFLRLWSNDLSGPIPPELGNLGSVEDLDVFGNDLSGPIPPELGELASLTRLQLGANSLTGLIPRSLLDLTRLTRFYFERNEGLCAPGIAGFADWLGAMEDTSGPYCNQSDVGALNLLYETAGGPDWTNSSRWLETPALDEWYGVTADALGRVVTLDLSRNGLAGEMPNWPPGAMAQMTELRIADNPDLSGRLPLSLAGLSLRVLHYGGTELCAPAYASFREWLRAIPSHEGTDAECAPLSDREILEIFYEATGGPNWDRNDNWLTDAPLGDWYGVGVDGQGRVTELEIQLNRLMGQLPPELGSLANLRSLFIWLDGTTGPIPPELGNLANLRSLRLMSFADTPHLTGPIPPELGNLANLQVLELWNNDLTGPIPPELGDLARLRHLGLDQNRLTGPIPPELTRLANLTSLHLSKNDLAGPILPEIGDLADLRSLNLASNRLSGPIPPELGGPANLESLYLGDNELTGPVPPALGGLIHMRHLALQANAGMSGALPASLTNLTSLETFQTAGTSLCAPSDAGFLDWLERVANRQVALCGYEPATAYLVQAVQSREFPVPLIAGKEALLRVFVTAGRDNDERLPPVRASFYLNGALAHVAEIASGPGPIPTQVDEGSLAISANAVVPAEVVLPGLEMVVEVDPDGTLDSGLGVARWIPETGRAAVDVRAVPLLDLTLVPFLWAADPDSAVLESVRGMAADPRGHEMLELLNTLLPVGDMDVEAHEPVLSSSNNGWDLIDQTGAIRTMEGGTGYWMGIMSGSTTGPAVGRGVWSYSIHSARVIAHEFGHNFTLGHAPSCGAGTPDSAYPKPDGSIGVWGYDFRDGSLVPPSWTDVMGYCEGDPEWISDYHFSKALHFRLFDDHRASVTAQEAESLLLWGGADADGELYLHPAFVVDAPPVLPDAAGEHRIAGQTVDGDELFSFSFTMPEMAHGEGRSSFAFALPVQPEWAGELASVTISGPGGSFTLDGETDLPMTILRNPRSGQVRGILRDLPPVTQAAMDAAGQTAGSGLEMLFSRGIPGAEAWR